MSDQVSNLHRSALVGIRLLLAHELESMTRQLTEEEYRLHVLQMHADELAQSKSELDLMWDALKTSKLPTQKREEAMQQLLQQSSEIIATQQRVAELGSSLKNMTQHRERLYEVQRSIEDLAKASGVETFDPLEPERLQKSSRQAFQMIEEERMRIARDMHDGPAQSLSNLVLQAEVVERLVKRDPASVINELKDFKEGVRQVLDDTRRLIFDLRPMTLDDLGLVPTLRKFVTEFQERSHIQTHLRVIGKEQRLPSSLEPTMFRVIQEALNNVRKHAKAKNVDVIVTFGEGSITAVVKDDGIGFDVDHVEEHTKGREHLGLTSMHERAELELGTLLITSQPGHGTEVRVSLQY